jgi:hypothetical protein
MGMELIEVLDTAIKIGLGGVIGGLFTLLHERTLSRRERDRRTRELHQQLVLIPIVTFIDEFLSFMSDVYWTTKDGGTPAYEQIEELRKKDALITARVNSLGYPDVAEKFAKMSRCMGAVTMKYSHKKLGIGPFDAKEDFDQATQLASDLYAALLPAAAPAQDRGGA